LKTDNLVKNWHGSRRRSIGDRIREAVLPEEPFRERLEAVKRTMDSQVDKIRIREEMLRKREAELFRATVESLQKRDNEQVSAYSRELAEVRKTIKAAMHSKIILERMRCKIDTIQGYGDLASTISGMLPFLRAARRGLTAVLPEADPEMARIMQELGGMVLEAGSLGGFTVEFEPMSEEAEFILAEAAAVAGEEAEA